MTRLRSIFVFAAVVISAMGQAACGGEDGGGATGTPQEVVDKATLKGIESGELELSFNVDAPGKEGGDFDLSLSGPFQGGGKGELPQLDVDATAKGSMGDQSLDFEGGLVLLPNSAYVNYQGVEYEVDPTTFSFAESVINPVEPGAGAESANDKACQEVAGELKVSQFIDRIRNSGDAEVGDTATTRVSGDLDVPGALDALLDVAEDPACSAQLSAVGELPSRSEVNASQEEVERSLKSAKVEIYVGEDNIVRQLSGEAEIDPPKGSGKGPRTAKFAFELKLTGVNEEQEISAPESAKPLSDLFVKLGVNPLELLGILQGERGESFGNLLEGLGRTAGGADEGGSGGGNQQAYLKCLGNARTPVDLQKCTRLAG